MAPVLSVRDGDGYGGLIEIPEQELGEGIAAGMGGALGRIRLENEVAARKLVSDLIEVFPVELEPGAKSVLAARQAYVIDELQRVVLDDVGPVGVVADSA